jgi:hypothetical protein
MYPSKLSDDDLYDEYLEPTAYDNSSNATSTSLYPHSPSLSPYESIHYDPRLSQTIPYETSHTLISTDLNAVGSETGGLYLSDRIGVENELHAMFGNSYEEQRTEYNIPGPYQTLDLAELDSEFYSLYKAESPGDVWYDRQPYVKSAKQFGDFTTTQTTAHNHRVDHGERLACDRCDKHFTLRHDHLRHIRTVHRQEHDHVYRCAVPGCTKGDRIYNRLDNFKKHLKTTHRTESLKEVVQNSRTSSGDTFTILTPDTYSAADYAGRMQHRV